MSEEQQQVKQNSTTVIFSEFLETVPPSIIIMSKQLKKTENTESQNKLVVFQGKSVRRAWYNSELY